MPLILSLLGCLPPFDAVRPSDTDTAVECVQVGYEVCGNRIDEDCDGEDAICTSSLADAHAIWEGVAERDWAGDVLAPLGDIDGDGVPDILIGAKGADSFAGAAYAVTDHSAGVSRGLATASVTFSTGAFDNGQLGFSATGLVEDDGSHHAYVFGAPMVEGGDPIGLGAVYVVTGSFASGGQEQIDLDARIAAEDPNVVTFLGPSAGARAGFAVGSAGDLDNDDHPDVIASALYAWEGSPTEHQGIAYVLFGPFERGPADPGIRSLQLEGVAYWGEGANEWAGCDVAGVGDVDGDGKSEVAVGACGANGNAGTVYVVDEGSSHFLGSGADFALTGENPEDHAGVLVAAAGDVDGDGRGDVLVGAHSCGFDRSNAPECVSQKEGRVAWYVVSGDQLVSAVGHSMSLADAWTRVKHDQLDNHFSCHGAATGKFVGGEGVDLVVGGCWESAGGVQILADLSGGFYEAPSSEFTVLSGVLPGDRAGAELAVSGDKLVVGAWKAGNVGTVEAGAVYVMPAGTF